MLLYNNERQHQSLGYRTPQQIYEESLWICGRSASPTGCASPTSRASSESGEMLAFAHIPTGATANKGQRAPVFLLHENEYVSEVLRILPTFDASPRDIAMVGEELSRMPGVVRAYEG